MLPPAASTPSPHQPLPRILGFAAGGHCDPRLVVALSRAGALGVLDLDSTQAKAALEFVARHASRFAVRSDRVLDLPPQVDTIILPSPLPVTAWRPRRVLVQVTSLAEAEAAVAAGADGLIAVGHEAGGRVGDECALVLLQRLLAHVKIPVWAQGGIGTHTAAAAVAGGAAGVVLDSQLALVRESSLPRSVKDLIASLDGSETTVIGGHRVLTRPDLPVLVAPDADAATVRAKLGATDPQRALLPLGQEVAFARALAERFATAGGVVQAMLKAIDDGIRLAAAHQPLAPDSPLARDLGTRYPILQGPMTRVSDRAAFARAVADGGGLPFLALALLRGAEVQALVQETATLLGDRPWGVGILGFVPAELRQEQLAAIEATPPPFAIIAGGRPSQAKGLEKLGTKAFLHVPSPGLLELFLKEGARRFMFEGRESGGHVGPRGSFALWESQLEVLRRFDKPQDLTVVFAGGIHDARSAAMVAAMAAPLAARGAKVGVLMGTAYLFTEEIVATGAVVPLYQRLAAQSAGTTLLETAPGHATRCLDTEYVQAFRGEKQRLEAQGLESREVWANLEQLNLGRLRLATKGLERRGQELVKLDEATQAREGMYMIGQVAALRTKGTTIAALHREVCEDGTALIQKVAAAGHAPVAAQPADVAVIGMACIFPGAPDLEAYWHNLVFGTDAIREVPAERWSPEIYFDPKGAPGLTTPSKWGGFLDPVPFEPLTYGIPPKSLASIEPVQILSLEVAKRALDDAGYGKREFDRSRAAVIFGAEAGTDLSGAYGFRALFPQYAGRLPKELEDKLPLPTEDTFPGILANVIAGRIANRLDLGGVNYTVDAACASSLAAVLAGVQALSGGTADLVLAGGADLHNSIHDFLMFSSVHALSPTGRCHTFDQNADGIALGEGVGVAVLKRLADAERDGDRIYAVLKGIAGSSDGKSLGLTAPRKDGQIAALRRCYALAGTPLPRVGLMEAHGTGTVVGDRTELESMTEVFRDVAPGQCALGSVKAQIGHTKCAAGMASLIKVALALHRGVLPPTVHVEQPNGAWSERSAFAFLGHARPWHGPHRAGALSAFGFGGTNFHAVLEAHDGLDPLASGLPHWPAELLLFRGADRDAAFVRITTVEKLLEAQPPHRLRDLAAGLAQLDTDAPVQIAIVARSLDDLRTKLGQLREGLSAPGLLTRDRQEVRGPVAFLFPGQGSQRLGMGAELFLAFPQLRTLLPAAAEWLDRLWPAKAFTKAELHAQLQALTDTRVAQPMLGLCDFAAAQLLAAVGVKPDHAAGHSYGELAALCVAGAINPHDLLPLSRARAEAILAAAGSDPGAMVAAAAPTADLEALTREIKGLALANHNAPAQTILSGPTTAIDQALTRLAELGVGAKRLPVACAFHSSVVAGAEAAFAATLASTELRAPEFPVWSNTTAERYPAEPAAIRTLLARQLAQPVRFVDQVRAMWDAGCRIFVEVGPGRVLTGLTGKILEGKPHAAIATDADRESGLLAWLQALAHLAVLDVKLDTTALFAGRGCEPLDWTKPVARRLSPTTWWVTGQRAWPVHGEPPAGAMRPVVKPPVLLVPEGSALPRLDEREQSVAAYLRNLRELADAQRQVMLSWLGTPVAPVEAEIPPAGMPVLAPTNASPTPATPATPAPPAPAAAASDLLLTLVSERTGYPREMLGLDLDLEADLGIDSIKRIEILGALNEKLGIVAAADDRQEELVEELAGRKTLRGILEWLDAHRDAAGEPVKTIPAPVHQASTRTERIARYVVGAREAGPIEPQHATLAGKRLALTDDGGGVAVELQRLLRARGAEVQVLAPDAALGSIDGLVHLTSLAPGNDPDHVKGLFALAKAAVAGGAQWVIGVTGMGGRLGHGANGHGRPGQGGIAGLLKSLAKERPELRVRAIDVDLAEGNGRVAAHILDELLADGPEVEVGYSAGVRRTTEVRPMDHELPAQLAAPLLEADSVVLITGGARGITAQAALALAQRYRCKLELVGRSAPPAAAEPSALAACLDAKSVKRWLLDEHPDLALAEVEKRARRILSEREIGSNLAALRAAGAQVRYHQLDVRDREAFGALLDRLYQEHGRLDGVLHGAGVIEDKLLAHKTPESFARVFDTKVRGALTLAAKLRDDVRFVVFFSSVSSAFGNRGQIDYAAANDVLDKLAHHLNEQWRGRVVSVNWGPWASAGMVSPELEREYHKRGIGLIPLVAGAESLVTELEHGTKADAQVILMNAGLEAFLGAEVAG